MRSDFDLGRFGLVSGSSLPSAQLTYETHGELDDEGSNCILLPSYYTGTSSSYEPWIGPGRLFDPAEWFIVAVNLFGNGVSTSPSRAHPEIAGAAFPDVDIADNVIAQHRLLTHLGVKRIRLIAGWSMGALQAYEWAARYPGLVDAILPIAGAARCSPHNFVFLEGVKAALLADPTFRQGRYITPPVQGLRAFGTVYAGWAYSQEFFRHGTYRELGYASVDSVIQGWAADHEQEDANDLLAMLGTWQRADVGKHHPGGFEGAMGDITARAIVMPGSTDLYFPQADSEREVELLQDGELRPLVSELGHIAGRPGVREAETAQIRSAVQELLRN
ncbi:alpha/beta fold hydrolase [Arthrobacter cheniae]|uniref:Alpha/beta fold hydrolase n=1 Tax=Arthrobacter cheniae TaxID=1258888 RepID=A0A3A5LZE1_9MICC|nr:alpha/beta fold hydrolase [Arthrobacter cheniae]RJT78046.1 alpha/beta fold hydrolase [Arthrobacter cheniae]